MALTRAIKGVSITDTDVVPVKRMTKAEKEARPFSPEEFGARPDTTGIAGELYQYAVDSEESRPQRRVYASSIKNCPRQVAFSIWGLTQEPPQIVQDNPQWKITARVGTVLHDMLEDWLKRKTSGRVRYLDSEFRLSYPEGADDNEVEVSGRVDALVEVDGEPVIIDVKTVDQENYDAGAWSKKFPKYYQQLQLYMAHPAMQRLGVKKAVVLFFNRNKCEMKGVEFDYNPEVADKLLKLAKATMRRVWKRSVPPRDTSQCFFCPFQRQCQAEEEDLAVTLALVDGDDLSKL